jgi:hypothetical protein
MQLNLSSFSLASLLASICLLLTSELGFAQSYSGGFIASRVVQVRWKSTQLSSDYVTKYVRPGFNGWNGISSKVSLSQVAGGDYDVDVVPSSTTEAGLVGAQFPYCLIRTTLINCGFYNEVWAFSLIAGYTNQITNLKLSDSEIISSVYAHEMGHTLSMDHTSPPTGTISIMKSGFRGTYLPQAFDKTNLRKRWGN